MHLSASATAELLAQLWLIGEVEFQYFCLFSLGTSAGFAATFERGLALKERKYNVSHVQTVIDEE